MTRDEKLRFEALAMLWRREAADPACLKASPDGDPLNVSIHQHGKTLASCAAALEKLLAEPEPEPDEATVWRALDAFDQEGFQEVDAMRAALLAARKQP